MLYTVCEFHNMLNNINIMALAILMLLKHNAIDDICICVYNQYMK